MILPDMYIKLLMDIGFTNLKLVPNNEIIANCKFCGEQKQNFQANYKKKVYKCWVCGTHGSLKFLFATESKLLPSYIKKYLSGEYYGDDELNIELQELGISLNRLKRSPDIVYKYKHNDKLWKMRGLSIRTIRKFRLGYDVNYHRLVIPIIYRKKLVAVIGRSIHAYVRPKYLKILPEGHWDKQKYLFGLDFVINKYDSVVLVEGQIDCIKCYELGLRNTVAIMGTQLSSIQQKLITSNFRHVILMLDNDLSGRRATYGWNTPAGKYIVGIIDKLTQEAVDVSVCKYSGKDPGDLQNLDSLEIIPSKLKIGR